MMYFAVLPADAKPRQRRAGRAPPGSERAQRFDRWSCGQEETSMSLSQQAPILAGTPDHPITIASAPHRVRVTFAGRVIADTRRALSLVEASYPPVMYIPPDDVDLTVLGKTDRKTHCPYKGEASYYSIRVGDRNAPNAVWTYEQPPEAVAAIAKYMAFYPDRVDSLEQLSD
jgi:uncharacterized protein (DUF427 family)